MGRTARELAEALGGELSGDGSVELSRVASLEEADGGCLSFVDSHRRLAQARASGAGCLFRPPDLDVPDRVTIAHPEPKRAFARAIELIVPPASIEPGVHPSAVVHETARLGGGVHVGPHAVIEAGVVLGPGVYVGPGSVIGEGSRIGAGSHLLARVVVYPGTSLGERVLVHAGAVLGSDGFGFVRGPEGKLEKFPQVGRLIIEDDVEIGAGTCIDRGALGATVIGAGTKLDNLVQVAHNVVVGCHCAVSAQVGIAGSSVIENGVTLAGQVGIADHVRVEEGATVGAQAGVPSRKIIRRGHVVWGTPARPLADFKRQYALLGRIEDLRDRLGAVERELEGLLGRTGREAPRAGGSG